jgi:hypothetical protein
MVEGSNQQNDKMNKPFNLHGGSDPRPPRPHRSASTGPVKRGRTGRASLVNTSLYKSTRTRSIKSTPPIHFLQATNVKVPSQRHAQMPGPGTSPPPAPTEDSDRSTIILLDFDTYHVNIPFRRSSRTKHRFCIDNKLTCRERIISR